MRARPAIALVALVLLVGCTAPAASGSGPAQWDADGVRFSIPDGWEVRASTMKPVGDSRRLLYLATQPLRDDCSGSAGVQTCGLPIDQLLPGGVLLGWHTTTCAGPACSLPDGDLTQVGGRAAVIVPAADGCGTIGQTAASAYLVSVSPQRLDAIVVCSRGATAAMLASLRAFLDGVEWRTP
jgi:hypothetical protein